MAVYSPVVGLLTVYGAVRQEIPSLDRLERILEAVPEVQDRPAARPLSDGQP